MNQLVKSTFRQEDLLHFFVIYYCKLNIFGTLLCFVIYQNSFLIKETFTLNNFSPFLSVNSIGLFGSYLLCFVEVVKIKNVVLCILYWMCLIIFDC